MKKLILALALFLFLPVRASATCHVYLVPSIPSPIDATSRRPKYVGILKVPWHAIDYGSQDLFLVATDVDDATDAAAVKNSDVIRIPDALDNQIGGSLSTVQTKMESVHLPFGWVTSGMTYREVVRKTTRIMQFFQKFRGVTGVTGPLFNGTTITLDTTFSSLSALNRQRLLDTAAAINLSTAGFTGASTLRQILKGVADQYADVPIKLGCATI